MRSALLATAVLLGACNDAPAPTNGGTGSSSTGAGASSSGTRADESTTVAPEPVILLDATLDLELRESIRVTFTMTGDVLEAELDASRGYGLLDGAQVGPARIDAYPEAEATVYTATFDGPAVADGPCGEQPVSLALALHHDGDADVIAGGLTGYCGATTFFGVPAIEPLRISGRVP
jgi:hypothetical protein